MKNAFEHLLLEFMFEKVSLSLMMSKEKAMQKRQCSSLVFSWSSEVSEIVSFSSRIFLWSIETVLERLCSLVELTGGVSHALYIQGVKWTPATSRMQLSECSLSVRHCDGSPVTHPRLTFYKQQHITQTHVKTTQHTWMTRWRKRWC